MTEFSEDRVYARHRRRSGAVLIVGAGAVGGFAAEELSRVGVSPLHLVDHKRLKIENVVRHPLGAWAVGLPKASTLADKIRHDFPHCEATADDKDFLELPEDEQLRLVAQADVVVGATDQFECQRRINEVCITAERPAVFPGIWVDQRVRDAEVGEVLWVLPGRHTACYECAHAHRQSAPDAQAARGARVDVQLVALVTTQVVAGLLDPTDVRAAILDPERTCIYLHGFTPTSRGVQGLFPTQGLRNLFAHVPFPPTPCRACRGQESAIGEPVRRRWATTAPPSPAIVSFRVRTNYLTAEVDTRDTQSDSGVTFSYDWGDGSSSDNPQHTYARAGNYPVTVTATNSAGPSTDTSNVTVTAPLPIRFTVTTSGSTVSVDTMPLPGVSFTYQWGDGSTSLAPSHRYLIAGTYTITVIGESLAGESHATYEVTVSPPRAGVPAPPPTPSIPDDYDDEPRIDPFWKIIIGIAVVAIIVIGIFVPIPGTVHHSAESPNVSLVPDVPPTHGFPPRPVRLRCIPGGGGFYCKGTLHWASVLTLSVQGLTQQVVNRLCAKGYRSRWSQNMEGYPRNPPMCPGSDPLANVPDYSSGNKNWQVPFQPPTRNGRWVIVWRLYNPSGRLVRSARYKVRVAPP